MKEIDNLIKTEQLAIAILEEKLKARIARLETLKSFSGDNNIDEIDAAISSSVKSSAKNFSEEKNKPLRMTGFNAQFMEFMAQGEKNLDDITGFFKETGRPTGSASSNDPNAYVRTFIWKMKKQGILKQQDNGSYAVV